MKCWKLNQPGHGPIFASKEEWKKCTKKLFKNYTVSTLGRIKLCGRSFNPRFWSNYYRIDSSHTTLPLHRLVMDTFKPNPYPSYYMCTDHINRDTKDNRLCNLRWSTFQSGGIFSNPLIKPTEPGTPVRKRVPAQ